MNGFFTAPETITVLLILLWLSGFAAGFGKILFWTALVGRYEYRIDRFLDFLSTRQGLFLLLHPVGIADILVALMLIVLFQSYDATSSVWIQFAVLSVVIYTWHAVWYFSSRTAPRLPQWEFKTVFLVFGSVVLSIATLTLPHIFIDFPVVISIAFFQILIPIYGWIILGIFAPLLLFLDRSRLEKAQERIIAYAPAVIMLAGSYGKSTTKAYLEHILGGSFLVVSTSGQGSSDQNIATTVLEQLNPEHQILLVELQTNGRGDIAHACLVAPPIMTIITEIDESHDSRFSTYTFSDAISEAITALPANGLAVLNRDDAQSMKLASYAQGRARTKFFSAQDIAHVYATEISVQRDSVAFVLHIGDEKRSVRAPLFGKQVLYSILAATAAATHLGVPIDTIIKKIEEQPRTAHGMQVFYGLNHALVIDNTGSQSPAEREAALEYLSIYSDKHLFVLTNESLQHIIDNETDSELVMGTKKTQAVIAFLRQQLTPDHVILLQGNVSEKIQQALQQR
jgi:UDP-N-acetylmuramyl pentapeptide synthase